MGVRRAKLSMMSDLPSGEDPGTDDHGEQQTGLSSAESPGSHIVLQGNTEQSLSEAENAELASAYPVSDKSLFQLAAEAQRPNVPEPALPLAGSSQEVAPAGPGGQKEGTVASLGHPSEVSDTSGDKHSVEVSPSALDPETTADRTTLESGLRSMPATGIEVEETQEQEVTELTDEQLQHALLGAFTEVRDYLLQVKYKPGTLPQDPFAQVGTNDSGHPILRFDLEAEKRTIQAIEHLPSVRILAEETGETRSNKGTPLVTLLIDACDGSNNLKHNLPGTSFSVAVLSGDPTTLRLERVTYALVGDIETGSFWTASRGKGANVTIRVDGRYLDTRPIYSSQATDLNGLVASMNIGRFPNQATIDLLGQVDMKRVGSIALELARVAQGGYGFLADLRSNPRATVESFLAGAFILQEAGGVFRDGRGQPFGPVEFNTPYNMLAAGNEALLREMLKVIDSGSPAV